MGSFLLGSVAALLLGDRHKVGHALARLIVKTEDCAIACRRKGVELSEEWEDIVAEARVEHEHANVHHTSPGALHLD